MGDTRVAAMIPPARCRLERPTLGSEPDDESTVRGLEFLRNRVPLGTPVKIAR
jgi:hypothetical protein